MITTEGLTAIRVVVEVDTSSVRDGLSHTNSIVLNRKEVEREGNAQHGADNMLDPNWRTLTGDEFLSTAMRIVERVSGAPFIYPLTDDDRPHFYTSIGMPEGSALILLPQHIRNIKLIGEYGDHQ